MMNTFEQGPKKKGALAEEDVQKNPSKLEYIIQDLETTLRKDEFSFGLKFPEPEKALSRHKMTGKAEQEARRSLGKVWGRESRNTRLYVECRRNG